MGNQDDSIEARHGYLGFVKMEFLIAAAISIAFAITSISNKLLLLDSGSLTNQ
jgi:hypothetical protein